jgi:hypothetical protein
MFPTAIQIQTILTAVRPITVINLASKHPEKKNAAFCDVTPYDSYKNRRFGRTYRLRTQRSNNRRDRNLSSNWQPKQAAHYANLVTANVPMSLILVTLMVEAICSSKTSVLISSQKTAFYIVTAAKASNLTYH